MGGFIWYAGHGIPQVIGDMEKVKCSKNEYKRIGNIWHTYTIKTAYMFWFWSIVLMEDVLQSAVLLVHCCVCSKLHVMNVYSFSSNCLPHYWLALRNYLFQPALRMPSFMSLLLIHYSPSPFPFSFGQYISFRSM